MAYSNSKLCQIFFTKELAARLKSFNVSVFSVHPGVVRTEIFKRIQGFRKLALDFFYNFYFKVSNNKIILCMCKCAISIF